MSSLEERTDKFWNATVERANSVELKDSEFSRLLADANEALMRVEACYTDGDEELTRSQYLLMQTMANFLFLMTFGPLYMKTSMRRQMDPSLWHLKGRFSRRRRFKKLLGRPKRAKHD